MMAETGNAGSDPERRDPDPTPPPPPGALISMFRTLLCTRSKAAIAAHQLIQEEARNSRGRGFSRPAHHAILSPRVSALDLHWTASLWESVSKRVEADPQAAWISLER